MENANIFVTHCFFSVSVIINYKNSVHSSRKNIHCWKLHQEFKLQKNQRRISTEIWHRISATDCVSINTLCLYDGQNVK
jgi:hypothetical protein